ncbi:unnamed protein product [Cylindrotheca closterium]|uniref:Uncharacterized protein n=1 Tax=Cylindrotheca closterium TaxID=2856 RepID=A0AAD2G528_9STRA|nr:unnamed protein product [Cylindrotheca closterium]
MIRLWDPSTLRINTVCVMLMLAASSLIGVESSSWNHPDLTDVHTSSCRYQHREIMDLSILYRGGSDQPMDESQIPRRKKFFRKKRGKLNIRLGRPERNDQTYSYDETKSFSLPMSGAQSKAPATNATSQFGVKEDDSNKDSHTEVELSMDVFALLRLAQHLGGASQVAFAAVFATLKMLGPMVMAQKCFEWLGGCKGYDHLTDLKAVEKPTTRMEKYGILEGIRAIGRVAVRFSGMYLFGILCTLVLSASSCAMPEQLCKYWYALVWTLGVKSIAHANELLFLRYFGGLFELRPERNYFPLLPPARLFKIPSPTIRWVYLFFGVVDNVLKVYSDEDSTSSQVIGPLFPSTWPYLQLFNIFAMFRVMKQSLPESPKAVLIGFCLQSAVYEEWFRVFLEERRVALGAIMSMTSLLVTTFFIYSTAAIDKLATGLLLPFGLASVVATWMSFVLCGREFSPVERSQRPRAFGSSNLKATPMIGI